MSFKWSVSGGIEALSVLAGIRFDRMFTELDAIVEAYREGLDMARDLFGPDIPFGTPRAAAISYGHINCLGSTLVFPENSEVAHTPIYDSLREGVRSLRAEVDFIRAGMFPFYLDLWDRLKRAFPGQTIPFQGFGSEGPVTTAWLLRGHDFFMDIYDDPFLAREYLGLVTRSIVKYRRLISRINGEPELSTLGAGLVDDAAAMIRPGLWPELVMPFLEEYFTDLTSGSRSAHIEDLRAEHLHYLDALRLEHFDPSVSAKLTPALIRAHCSVPFTWRLNEGTTSTFTVEETQRWVLDAAAQGAPAVRTGVWRNNCTRQGADNVRAFMETAQRVQELLERGCPRDRLVEEAAGGVDSPRVRG